MSVKSIAAAILLLFVGASVVYLAVGGRAVNKSDARRATQTDATCARGESCIGSDSIKAATGAVTVAYYFHRTARCRTCRALESNARKAIQGSLADELAKGQLIIEALNVEEPANRHFVERYQIAGPSLVLSRIRDGKEVRWKNLDRIWDLIRSPSEYQAYVAAETKTFMNGES